MGLVLAFVAGMPETSHGTFCPAAGVVGEDGVLIRDCEVEEPATANITMLVAGLSVAVVGVALLVWRGTSSDAADRFGGAPSAEA